MSANIEQIQAMLERTGNTNLLQKQDVDLEKERLQLEATIKGSDSIKAVGPFIPSNIDEELKKAAVEAHMHLEEQGELSFLNIFKAGAKWQAEQDQETIELAEDHAYLAGAVNEREKMMKEAVECVVCAGMEGDKWIMTYIGSYESMLKTCKAGDKVRIIICKKED